MNTKKIISTLLKTLCLANILVISQGLSAQGTQALSDDELKRINEQPLAKPVKNSRSTDKAAAKTPSFEHKDTDGTSIKEYQDRGKNREVVVETSGTRYEMSNPNTANTSSTRDSSVNRVPSVRMPF